ncbi:MAG TPA: EthD domain-containing protein [Phototrophicaceae bacterium]|nr:EthD domain-containing protein [Phototrophicaceae bacterium]
MLKRVTLLERRPDLPPAEFSGHWRTDHAAIATELPGLLCYRQNHVVETVTVPQDGPPYLVDGIVELWFTGPDDARAGLGSAVADRLVEDEPRFLAGLTGGTMTAPEPGPLSAASVWLLGCWDGPADRHALEAWVSAAAGDGAALHELDAGEPLLLREALRREPEMPQVLVQLPAADAGAALDAARGIGQHLPALSRHLRRVQVLAATVASIVEPRPAPAESAPKETN